MLNRPTLARFLTTPENHSAWMAVQDLLHALTSRTTDLPLLFLHGPSGTGKTLLIQNLADELAEQDFRIGLLSANDFAAEEKDSHDLQADLLIIEDLQHLPTRYVEALVQIIDERLRQQLPMLMTALHGPSHLNHRGTAFPQRLTTRLASGLVVALEPLQTAGRRQLLTMLAEQNELSVAPEILDWLAEHLHGGRQLEGAVQQLKTLQRLHKKPLCLDEALREHFRTQMEASAPTVQRIARHVSAYYQVEPRRLVSEQRTRDVLLPRQVSMYLARQLTNLSLEQIGRYFGGRDHKTVQHACKKVESAMKCDHALSGVVRQMHAELA
jgi:chromosomal replication initiator protein